MSEYFKNGGSHLERKGAYDQYTIATGQVGYGPSENDPNGSCYWADKNNMDPIWRYHDSNIAEHELGFNEGAMNGNDYVRVDCNDLSPHNQRIANGYEQGSNDNFTGIVTDGDGNKIIEPSIYNQRTSGGQPECVTNQMSINNCDCSEPRRFNDPNELSFAQCNKADTLLATPECEAKDEKINQWNTQTDALKNRLSGEQGYLHNRINDHEQRMSEFPKGSLEYNRAEGNRDWCQNYYNEISASKEKIQAKQDEINTSTKLNNSSSPNTTNRDTSNRNHSITAADTEQYPIKNEGFNGKVDTNTAGDFYNAKISPSDNSSTSTPELINNNNGFKM